MLLFFLLKTTIFVLSTFICNWCSFIMFSIIFIKTRRPSAVGQKITTSSAYACTFMVFIPTLQQYCWLAIFLIMSSMYMQNNIADVTPPCLISAVKFRENLRIGCIFAYSITKPMKKSKFCQLFDGRFVKKSVLSKSFYRAKCWNFLRFLVTQKPFVFS